VENVDAREEIEIVISSDSTFRAALAPGTYDFEDPLTFMSGPSGEDRRTFTLAGGDALRLRVVVDD